ncbi:hypothetical protein [Paenibacillus elgii]|uniref:hypothetical protein n=1 Tax=Paenibacillus elgii TaxID=189691 RepID=UPI00307A8FC8
MEQPIPCTAALIQEAMGQQHSGVPAFDINSTCLSFVAGLDVMSYMVEAGRYLRVLLVSTEIASKGLNWKQKESAALFGDGAAAPVIAKSGPEECSRILSTCIETYSAGAHLSEIRGGGSGRPAGAFAPETAEYYLFDMQGGALVSDGLQEAAGFYEPPSCGGRVLHCEHQAGHSASEQRDGDAAAEPQASHF